MRQTFREIRGYPRFKFRSMHGGHGRYSQSFWRYAVMFSEKIWLRPLQFHSNITVSGIRVEDVIARTLNGIYFSEAPRQINHLSGNIASFF